MLKFDAEELKKICSDLYDLTHIKLDLWDEDRNLLFSYPEKHRKFCAAVKNFPELCAKCPQSDEYGFAGADKAGRVFIYCCHLGLTEAVTPIVNNGKVIGYLTFGQAIEKDNVEDIQKKVREAAEKYGADENLLNSLLLSAKKTDRTKIEACADLMEMVTGYLWQKDIVSPKHSAAFRKATDYISSHLSEEIGVRQLCSYLSVSKTSLYSMFTENCGTGLNEYVRKQRIDEACRLLVSSDLSISEIAECVGIPDSNYFVRVFRRQTGITPFRFRMKKK